MDYSKTGVLLVFLSLSILSLSGQLSLELLAPLPDSINETSGLATNGPNKIWTHNDSGGENELYEIDTLGNILRKVVIEGASLDDWEDLTQDDQGNFYIGDFGNNDNVRTNLRIYIIPNPDSVASDTIQADSILFSYADQPGFPPPNNRKHYDMEAMIWYGGHLYLFSKNRTNPFDGFTRLYKMPANAGTYSPSPIDSIYLGPGPKEFYWVTAADISANKDQLVLLSYNRLWLFSCFSGDDFFGGDMQELTFFPLAKYEGVRFIHDSLLYISNESGLGAPTQLLKTSLSGYVNLPSVDLGADISTTEDSVWLYAGNQSGNQVSWSTGESTDSILVNTSGIYYVDVTDGNCLATDTIVVNFLCENFTSSINATSIACNGDSTATINLTVNNGTPGYTYVWSNGATSEDLSNQPAGTYSVDIEDVNGCTTSNSISISEPSALSTGISATSIACHGDSTASIDLTLSGGTPGYSFVWSNAATSEDLSNQPAGSYAVNIEDANGCTASESISISEPSALSTGISATSIACHGDSTATIDLTVSGGTPGYSFVWSNAATSEDLSNQPAGSYAVNIEDANGCTASESISISEPSALSTGISATSIACHGDSTATIDLTVSGGTPGYSFVWSNGSTSEDLSNQPAGSYAVNIEDANGCTASESISISEPSALSTGISATSIACHGDSTATIDLTVSGGTPGYSFVWSNGSTSEDLSNQPAGSYSVSIEDANGCTASEIISISEPSALSTSISATSIACHGDSTASIDLTVSGGTPGYSFVWSNAATSEDLSNQPAGSYSVSIEDANGCTASEIISISEPSAISTGISATSIACHGDSTATIDLTVSGGTPGYSFVWSNGSTSEDLSNQPAGSYSVSIEDANGCTASESISISEPSPISTGISATSIACHGDSTASIDLTVSGGTPGYSFVWSNAATSEDLSNQPAGSYSVSIEDANGCTASEIISISEPSAISTGISATSIACHGDSTAIIDLTVSGGTPGYSFVWSNAATSEDLSNQPAGSYSVSIEDANGCTLSDNITVSQPQKLVVSLVGVNIACFGDSTGSIFVNLSGGTPGYSFLWSDGSTSQNRSNMPAGIYTVDVVDANGCMTSDGIVLGQPTQLSGSISASSIDCHGDSTASIDLSVNGGTPAYSYLWSNGATSQDLSNQPAGSYEVIVQDAFGCTFTDSISISQPSPISSSIAGTSIACFGDSTGTANLTVSGGTPGYTFLWTNGATSQNLTNLPAGSYSVTVTDALGCTDNKGIILTEPFNIVASLSSTTINCFGDSAADIDLFLFGGTPGYTYLWSNGATSQDLFGQPAGSYTVTITDANGCQAIKGITVSQPDELLASFVTGGINCTGDSTGTIDLTVSGGTPGYTFVWDNGATSEDLSNLPAGNYAVIIEDLNGCESFDSVSLVDPAPLAISLSGTAVDCFGDSTGNIDLTISGGTPGYNLIWSNGATTEDLSNLPAGNYSVLVTDSKGCSISDSISLTEPTALQASLFGIDIDCFGDSSGSVFLNLTGGTPAYSFLWSDGDSSQNRSNLPAGIYMVDITDANGCTAQEGINLIQPTPLFHSVQIDHILCAGDSTGSIDFMPTGGTPAYSYSWSNGSISQDLNNIPTGTYTVLLTDANGCTLSESFFVDEPTALQSATAEVHIDCYGDSSGSINLTVTGGNPAYSYLWSNGATSQDLSNIPAGIYTVNISDNSNCVLIDTVHLTESAPLVSSLSGTDIDCFGASSGSIDLTVSGGVPAYTYSWSNGMSSEDLANLTIGSYLVQITDSLGCMHVDSVQLSQPDELLSSLSGVPIDCNGDSTGSIDLTVSGGVLAYTYSWSNGASSEDLANISAGTYTVEITDANGCVRSDSLSLSESPALQVSLSASSIDCFGDSTVSIDLTVGGGTPAYTYSWSTGSTSQDLMNLPAGSYWVIIEDSLNCIHIDTLSITQPDELVVSLAGTHVDCFGDSTGAIDLTVTGGTAGYTFLWSNAATSEDLVNLPAGMYSVLTTDTNGCNRTDSLVISEPNALSSSAVVASADCDGSPTGAIDLMPTGGTAPYAFTWDNGMTTEDLSNLFEGSYIVLITDSLACTHLDTIEVDKIPDYVISGSMDGLACFGYGDGSISLSISGGSMPFTYSWSTGDTSQNLLNLDGGTYTVYVSDSLNCQLSETFVLFEPPLLEGNIVSDELECAGGTDGALDLTVWGGTPSYSFMWSNGIQTEDLMDLSAGTYTVTVTDSNGCQITASATLIDPQGMLLSPGFTLPECFGTETGSISLSIIDGTPPYSYDWSNGDTTQNLMNVGSGFHSVTVTDADGCTASADFFLPGPAPILSNFEILNPFCHGQFTGSIMSDPSGGASPYSFSWSTGDTTASIFNLGAGTYEVLITDADGCTSLDTAMLTEPDSLIISFTTTPDNGSSNGSITPLVQGGVPPYSFTWSTGSNDSLLTGLSAGTYTLDIIDANGCVVTAFVEVLDNTSIEDLYGLSHYVLSPNPTSGRFQLTLDWQSARKGQIRIYTIQGKLIQSVEMQASSSWQLTANLSDQASGMYLIQILTQGQQAWGRIILQK